MSNIIQFGQEAFIIFLFPIIGLIFDLKLSKKNLYLIILFSFLFIVPIFFSYWYVIPFAIRILILLLLSAFYALYIKTEDDEKFKIRTSWIFSLVLFLGFGFFAILDGISGYQKVIKVWRHDKYKVEYILDQGFAGGPLMKYELSKYSFIPLLIKKIEVTIDSTKNGECSFLFKRSGISFNRCNGTLTKNAP
jgi:hypothetical protein